MRPGSLTSAPRGPRQRLAMAACLAAAGAAAGAGCSGAASPATIEAVLIGDRRADSGGPGGSWVARDGDSLPAEPGAALRAGDRVHAAPDRTVVLAFAAGYRVAVEPGTEVTIDAGSVFLRLGELIVMAVRDVAEAFAVRTEFASAAVEGTEFVVAVDAEGVVTLTVVAGRVRLAPERADWAPVLVEPSATFQVLRRTAPVRVTGFSRQLSPVDRARARAGTIRGAIDRVPLRGMLRP